MLSLREGPQKWLLSLLLVSGTVAVLVAGPVIAGPGSKTVTKKVVKKVVKNNGGIFYAPLGQATYGPSQTGATTVNQLSLPPGKYAVTAKVRISGSGSQGCRLKSGETVHDFASADLGSGSEVTLPMLMAVSLPSGGTVSVACSTPAGSSTADQAKIIAIRGPTARGPIGPIGPQ